MPHSPSTAPEAAILAPDLHRVAAGHAPRTVDGPWPAKLAATYARKSDKNDFGIDRQHDLLIARAADDGYVVPDEVLFRFEDDNTTGTTTSRRGLDRLVALVETGEAPFRRIYVKDMTRFGRFDDPRYHHYLEVHLEKFGVTICYWENDGAQAELADPKNVNRFSSYLRGAMGSIISSEERRRMISRITMGMRDRVREGFYPGARPPYGTIKWLADRHTGVLIEPVPANTRVHRVGCFFRLAWAQDASREVIQRIFRSIESGRSLRSIARELQAEGVPSPGHGRPGRKRAGWSLEGVRRIARNPVYRGDFVWGRTTRTQFGAPLHVSASMADGDAAILHPEFIVGEAPISPEQWEAVQTTLDGNVATAEVRRASQPEYLLSGLVRCGHCGQPFHGHSPSKDRSTRYYRHDPRRPDEHGPCPHANRYVPAETLELAAREHLRAVLADEGLVTAVREEIARRRDAFSSGKQEQRVRELERQLARHRAALDSATEQRAYAANAAERTSIEASIRRISAEVMAYERYVVEARSEMEIVARAESRIHVFHEWTPERFEQALAAAPAERKRALGMLVDRVLVWPDRHEAELRVRPAA